MEKETKKKNRKKKRERTATENGISKGTDHYGSFRILLEYGDSERSQLSRGKTEYSGGDKIKKMNISLSTDLPHEHYVFIKSFVLCIND